MSQILPSPSDPIDPDLSCHTLLSAVTTFHRQNHFVVGTGTRADLLLRLALMQGELGELAEVVTKSPSGDQHGFTEEDWQHLQEEWTDVLYLLLGWAVELGWTVEDIAAMFERVHQKNMRRAPRHTTLARSMEDDTSPSDETS